MVIDHIPLRTFARHLRQNQSSVERLLWSKLRARQLNGIKFRRQQRIGPFIVDFCSLRARLVIEVDGGQHQNQEPYDSKRSLFLQQQGFRVLRFWNHEILQNLPGALERIQRELGDPPLARLQEGREVEDPHLASPQEGRGIADISIPLPSGEGFRGGSSHLVRRQPTEKGRGILPTARGQSLVEMALLMPLMILTLVALLELLLIIGTQMLLNYSAFQAASHVAFPPYQKTAPQQAELFFKRHRILWGKANTFHISSKRLLWPDYPLSSYPLKGTAHIVQIDFPYHFTNSLLPTISLSAHCEILQEPHVPGDPQ